ncbi:hypothetical protein P4O66_009526 [Electrophorus voltai]|uniref:Solute carrier family 5 member 8 n=1 Tax=Electrophorus voltai TaxID=2609070 RepID=A0AAD8ZCA8_9TELE|nr:hypothetical protein P4O66_009526 [Electrophorus voltai]
MPVGGGAVAIFSVWDYVVFAAMVLGAAVVGLFQAIRGRKGSSSTEFLLGGRQMTAVPVAMSLTASFMSGITVIGTPSEAYIYGTPFWLFAFSYTIMSTISAEIFVPLFYRLGITSTYEYLEMRFNKLIRVIGTSMYIVQTALYTGMVIYAPALALNQITGLDLWGVLVATGVVCIVYCTLLAKNVLGGAVCDTVRFNNKLLVLCGIASNCLTGIKMNRGGLKAVIWTDVFQMVIMLSGFMAVITQGAVLQGGFGRIWDDNYKGGRLDTFSFDPDPLRRHSFWTIVVGGSVMWTSMYAINQSQVQRYISCRTMTHAKMSLYVNMVGLWVTVSLAMFTGLTMYSIYKDCDPLTNKDVGASDQLLPYLVMDILAEYPGVPGLFVAAAYSGTLSTVSSSINALVAVTVEDFVKPMWPSLMEKQVSWINMGLSVFFGGLCITMAAIASLMGSILQAALSIFGIISGPLLGLFLMGMFFRCANSTVSWQKLMSISLCTSVRPALANSWYSLSYLYFCPLGMLATMTIGLIISTISGGNKQEKIRQELFIQKGDFICFRCSKDTENPDSNLIEKVESDHTYGLDNPHFSDMELDIKEKDQDKITKL